MVGGFSLLGGLTAILIETTIAAKFGPFPQFRTLSMWPIPSLTSFSMWSPRPANIPSCLSSLLFEARHLSDELHRGFSYAVNILLLGLSGIALLGAVTAPLVIRAIAPGLAATQIEFASQLCRWLFLIIVPAGVAEVFRSFFSASTVLPWPRAAGFFRNFVAIACILLTFNRYGLYSIVLGYFAGYLLQLIMLGSQIAISFRVRYSWTLAESGKSFPEPAGCGHGPDTGGAGLAGRSHRGKNHRLIPPTRNDYGAELGLQDSGLPGGLTGWQRGNRSPAGALAGCGAA